MKRIILLAIPAAAMAVLGANTASAETPSQYWQQCRSAAYNAYYGCLDNSTSWVKDTQCYWGGVADLITCDREFAEAVVGG